MKKILNALFLTLLTVLTFSSCSDVPAPYDVKGKGDIQLTGKGTKDYPYTISDLKKIADGKTVAWVQAYIVAGIKSSANLSINSASDVVFGTQPTDVKATAILIADSSTESDYTNCSAINLNGKAEGCSAVKAALNLVDNNTIELPRLITFKGTLVKNTWGLPGMKDVTAAILEDETLIGEGGSDIPIDENNPFGLDASNPLSEINADFEEQLDFVKDGDYSSNLNYDYSLEGWKNVAFVGDRKWTGVVFKDNTKYIQASANKGSAATYTSWFVSPAFTVDNIKDKTIEFDCAGAYFYATTSLKVYFLELVDGVMQKTEIPVTGIPTSGDNYTWVKGIKIDLSGQTGKIGFVGFEYVAEGGTSKSTTYQIDNIKSGKSEGGGETPGGGTELLTNGGFENWADGYPVDWKSASTASSATLEQSTDKRSGTSSVLVKGDTSNKRLGSKEMTLKAGTYVFSAYFKAATTENASACLGYVPVDDTGKAGSYVYDNYVNDITNAEWVTKSYTFTLSQEQKICLVVMNSKKPGKDLLIDDASLKTEDGGIIGGGEGPAPGPVPGEGDGTTIDTPYNVSQAQANQNSVVAYVSGYIVGGIKNDNAINTISSSADVVFNEGGTVVRATAVLIADSKDETDYNKCVVVNLPSGDIRAAINLQDNAENLKKKLTIKGKLRTYFGISGVRDINKNDVYKLE